MFWGKQPLRQGATIGLLTLVDMELLYCGHILSLICPSIIYFHQTQVNRMFQE